MNTVLDAPDNVGNNTGKYACQIILSWPYRAGFFGHAEPLDVPPTNEERYQLFKDVTKNWAEPFKTLVDGVTRDIEFKEVKLQDWAPSRGLRSNGRAVVMGDAMHLMTMCKSRFHLFCFLRDNSFLLLGPNKTTGTYDDARRPDGVDAPEEHQTPQLQDTHPVKSNKDKDTRH